MTIIIPTDSFMRLFMFFFHRKLLGYNSVVPSFVYSKVS